MTRPAASSIDGAPAPRTLRRAMDARHLVMITLGGVIGSGLFLSSGYTIHQAGPLGAVLAYLLGAFVVWLVMVCLGELAVVYPVSGSIHIYAARTMGPATSCGKKDTKNAKSQMLRSGFIWLRYTSRV